LAALLLAQHVGAPALVTVGTEDKARFCRDYGALAAINYRTEDFVARTLELTGAQGVDVVLDMVGAPYLERNLRILRRDGRLIFIAFQQGNRCDLDLSPVLTKRLRITGSTMRPRTVAEKAAIRDALAHNIWPTLAAEPHKTHLHAVIPWQRASDAHRLMHSSVHIGKIVLCVRP
jgi:NADPH:quinone reductase-like Zn-dependent oxidoreductase